MYAVKKMGPKTVVSALESGVIATLADYGIKAHNKPGAPGVYVHEAKIASLGLRFRKMCFLSWSQHKCGDGFRTV